MADPKKLTVEEMLAAARAEKGAGAKAAPKAATPPAEPAPQAEVAADDASEAPAEKPAAKPAAKSAGPKPAAAASGDEQDRRGFLSSMMGALIGTPLAIGFSSLAVTHLLWVLGFARFMFPNILTEPPTRFRVGFPDEYAPGQVQEKYKAQF